MNDHSLLKEFVLSSLQPWNFASSLCKGLRRDSPFFFLQDFFLELSFSSYSLPFRSRGAWHLMFDRMVDLFFSPPFFSPGQLDPVCGDHPSIYHRFPKTGRTLFSRPSSGFEFISPRYGIPADEPFKTFSMPSSRPSW